MAEVKLARVLHSSSDSKAFFVKERLCDEIPDPGGTYLKIQYSWSLAEFEELVEFVREHQAQLDPNVTVVSEEEAVQDDS